MVHKIGKNMLSDCLKVVHLIFATVAYEFRLNPENFPTNSLFMPYERLENDFLKGNLMFTIYQDEKIIVFMQLSKNDGYAMNRI